EYIALRYYFLPTTCSQRAQLEQLAQQIGTDSQSDEDGLAAANADSDADSGSDSEQAAHAQPVFKKRKWQVPNPQTDSSPKKDDHAAGSHASGSSAHK